MQEIYKQGLLKLDDNPGTSESETEIYCDGASSGNPGHAGIGVVIRYKTARQPHFTVHKISEYIGTATNNIAEYQAFLRGLKEACALGLKKITVFLDSELLVKQMTGIYKVKNSNLKDLYLQAQNILRKFDAFRIIHVGREFNKEADLLAKQSIKKFHKIHKKG
ncbi:MAG: ribonuclease HI family protein [Nitrospirae bacterium]|nr:ribonuclease HI family protein [Nitrospirota bacterium]